MIADPPPNPTSEKPDTGKYLFPSDTEIRRNNNGLVNIFYNRRQSGEKCSTWNNGYFTLIAFCSIIIAYVCGNKTHI